MFKKMRRNDRALTQEGAIDLLIKGEYGVLSTIGENGYAYGVPLSYVYNHGKIFLHAATEGLKLDNIIFNNKVCFTVIGDTKVLPEKFSTNYESTIVFGKASIVEGEEKIEGLRLIIEKYSPEFMESGMEYINRAQMATKVVKIEIDEITGKVRKGN
jgi:nitroimidazol reductase NimA-like FMN-containing flavoprotein (pyridoxamine 5'-phosphate oxidase superfamily)